jgi:two-component system, OmpR family, phosphate regulon sensor histidine kinase PhoR
MLAAFLAIDFYSSQALRQNYIGSARQQLAALADVASAKPPNLDNSAELQTWTEWMAQGGARVTVIDAKGRVLAESARDPEGMLNHRDRPEFQQAMAKGQGQSVRLSTTLNQEMVYTAVRFQTTAGIPAVIRMALPLAPIDASVAILHRKLLEASLVVLVVGAGALFVFFRSFARRVDRLNRFSLRLAHGDFRPLPTEHTRDELAELTASLNQAAASMDRTIHSLSGERNRSSAILRSMVEGVAVIDAEEKLVFSNQAFSQILNLGSSTGEGRPLIEILRNFELLGLIRRALKGEEGLQNDILMGTIQPTCFSVTAAPVKALESDSHPATQPERRPTESEKPSGAVVVLHDVTELRRLERVRQDFVANVSHEFKTPLTAIQGFAETLLSGAVDDPRNNRRFLRIIRDHATRLARLTDDLLKLARIEAGKLEVQLQPVGALEVVEACVETALLKSNQKHIALEVDVIPNLRPVRGDAALLRDVLQNLVDNAIQYTPPGGKIRISAEERKREVVITVADTGIGIPLSDQERIFERFYRVDAARSREAGGTGLGLSIAKHIVEVHGGRLWVESEVGAGSKFSFSIPVTA